MHCHVTLSPAVVHSEFLNSLSKANNNVFICHLYMMAVSFGVRGSLWDTEQADCVRVVARTQP